MHLYSTVVYALKPLALNTAVFRRGLAVMTSSSFPRRPDVVAAAAFLLEEHRGRDFFYPVLRGHHIDGVGRPKFNFDTAPQTVRSQTRTRASGRRALTEVQSTPTAWCGLSEKPVKDCFAPHAGFNAETARFVFLSAPRPAVRATSSSFFSATPGSA